MTDAQTIARGNEMLARAGLPPLTPEQAQRFLANRQGRTKDRREMLLFTAGTFATGYLFARLFARGAAR